MDLLKTIGNWIYSLAATMGGPGLLLVATADSSFVSIPEGNDLLIVILSIGKSWSVMAYYTTMTIIGSVIGCHLLFFSGRAGGRAFLEKRFHQGKIQRAELFIKRYGVWSVLIPSILPPPMPFKIFVLTAGVFQMQAWRFFIAVLLGRSIRYFMWGILAVIYGDRVRLFMIENIKVVGILLLAASIIATLCLWSINYRRRRRRESVATDSGVVPM